MCPNLPLSGETSSVSLKRSRGKWLVAISLARFCFGEPFQSVARRIFILPHFKRGERRRCSPRPLSVNYATVYLISRLFIFASFSRISFVFFFCFFLFFAVSANIAFDIALFSDVRRNIIFFFCNTCKFLAIRNITFYYEECKVENLCKFSRNM